MTVYWDYNATTPLDPRVKAAMLPFLDEIWGNPSSVHQAGRRARAFLDEARERAARLLGARPSEVVFTSGGTESANLAIFGAARLRADRGRHIVASAIEHHAVLHACDYLRAHEGFDLTLAPVDRAGRVDPEAIEAALRPDTVLVSVMAANNEVGTLQPVREIGARCRARGILFHTDAVQWFGKQPFTRVDDFQADLISICAHKLHGPKGAGALWIRSPLHPHPLLFGGGHENERRAGTENLAGIVGFVEALERFVKSPVFSLEQLRPLTHRIRAALKSIPGVQLVGPPEGGLPNTIAFVAERSDSITLLANLDLEGICASSGSACSAGSLTPSHVIQAMGYGDALANALVRFSLGRESTLAEVEYVENRLPEIIRRGQLAK